MPNLKIMGKNDNGLKSISIFFLLRLLQTYGQGNKKVKVSGKLTPSIRVFRVTTKNDDDNLPLSLYLYSKTFHQHLYMQCYHCFYLLMFKSNIINFCVTQHLLLSLSYVIFYLQFCLHSCNLHNLLIHNYVVSPSFLLVGP